MDALLTAVRRYALPVHCVLVVVGAVALYLYARFVALTARLATTGGRRWPDVPAPSVLAIWHGDAPSLLVAFARRRPRPRLTIMVARDPRGDCLALLCRMLGLRVVRGESGEGGWSALAALAREVGRGSCALITADGGGPARSAKVGAVALASATGAPLVAVGADCRPALFERRKWDRARNPVPFGRVTVALGRSQLIPPLDDSSSVERERCRLQSALEESAAAARLAALAPRSPAS